MISHYAETSVAVTTPHHQHLTLEDLEEAGLRVAVRHFSAKDLIFAPGDPDTHLYFLLSGTVRLYKIYAQYKEATLALLKDEGLFGELSLEEGSRQGHFAETLTEARVAVVRKALLAEALRRSPSLAAKLLSCFSERLRHSDALIESLLDREVSARLARLLVHLGGRFGEENGRESNSGTGDRVVLSVRLTHQDLASMIVCTREAVSKVMSEFQREGLIEVRNRRIAISPRLAEMS